MPLQLGHVACACGRPRPEPSNNPGRPVARQIVDGLQVHPELGRGPKGTRKEPRRVGRDPAFAVHDLVDALDGNAQLGGEFGLGDTQFCKELVAQNLAGMGSCSVAWNGN